MRMKMTFGDRLVHAFNAFFNRDPPMYHSLGPGYYDRPDRPYFTHGNERSIIMSIYNRISLDVSSVSIQHSRVDDSGRFQEVVESGLNNCLNLEANITRPDDPLFRMPYCPCWMRALSLLFPLTQMTIRR